MTQVQYHILYICAYGQCWIQFNAWFCIKAHSDDFILVYFSHTFFIVKPWKKKLFSWINDVSFCQHNASVGLSNGMSLYLIRKTWTIMCNSNCLEKMYFPQCFVLASKYLPRMPLVSLRNSFAASSHAQAHFNVSCFVLVFFPMFFFPLNFLP